MKKRHMVVLLALLLSMFLLMGCSGSSSGTGDDTGDLNGNGGDNGDSTTPAGTLLVNKLSVSVVPGGVELVTATAKDGTGNAEGCTVACLDENVATVVQNGSVFTITGEDYGVTAVTVTSDSGEAIEIPVQVYKFDELDVGELILSFTSEFVSRWNDKGSGQDNDGAYWHPVPPDGFHALGSLGIIGYGNPNGENYMFVVKAKDDTEPLPALAYPTDYAWVWGDQGTGSDVDGSFWKPIPPPGYVAMGLVAQSGYDKPPLEDVVCVREDLTTPGKAGNYIWHCVTGLPIKYFYSWQITAPDAGAHENAYLAPGTFVAVFQNNTPPAAPLTHDVMHVLNVELPMLVQGPTQDFVPQLSGYGEPEDETAPGMARAMLVPFTIITDNDHTTQWKMADSPFYRLERYVYYKRLYHNYNQTSVLQENSDTYISGVTTTESDTYWSSTSVSITASGGVSFMGIGGSISATVSTSFGYENMTSVSELAQRETMNTVYTVPGKAAALWQKYNRYVLKRHNGTNLETVSAWEFGLDSFTVDEYPDEE